MEAAIVEQKTEVTVAQQRQTLEQEVLYAANRLNTLRKQVAIAAKSDTIGQRRFEVAKQRYIIGKIDIPILYRAEREGQRATVECPDAVGLLVHVLSGAATDVVRFRGRAAACGSG